MLELSKHLKGENQIILGYRDVRFLDEELAEHGKVVIATEDGSAGTKGNVLDAIRENGLDAEVIYACGPTNAWCNQTVCNGESDRMLPFSGREDGMWCGSMSWMRL